MLDEKLSALIDDELDVDELDGCLDRLYQDAQSRQAWSRQHLLRAVMKEQASKHSVDIAESVMRAIEHESIDAPSQVSDESKVVRMPLPKWRSNTWVGGLAVAASVAIVAVMLPVVFNADSDTFSGTASIAQNDNPVTQRVVAQRQRVLANEEARRELQQYLLDHEALASGHGLSGQRSYMRMASPSAAYVAYNPE